MTKFWIVMQQVYKKNVKSGSWLFLVLSPLLFLGIAVAVGWFVSQTAAPAKVAVITDQPAVVRALNKAADGDVTYTAAAKTTANRRLTAEKIDGILTVTTAPTLSATYVERANAETGVDTSTLTAVLSQLKLQQTAAALNLSAAQVQALVTPAQVKKRTVAIEAGKQVAKNDTTALVNRGFASVLTVFIMVISIVYGSMLAQEIATEKGSRIMEILLSSVSATTQFFGKLAGILALLATQLVVYAVAGVVAWTWASRQAFVKQLLASVDLSVLWSMTSLLAILFFIIGTLTFAVLAAVCGSLVANQEQVNAAVMPISLLGMAGYMLAFMAQTGDAALIRVASYVPFLSIELMPVRLALGHATMGAAWLSLAVSVVFLAGFTWLAVNIYRTNVLVYSDAGMLRGMRKAFTIWRAERRN
ncbi:ABC transporter permease [Lacticaseibacillus daqingensis]|uniref:ABC transporter permease n=1 Tax=Lacticaseibacillus daqingensis TaxID=2486014 RepID=UPI000F77B961|nr:ABC transporter permease [Lacticaseibacillus daqingensis]